MFSVSSTMTTSVSGSDSHVFDHSSVLAELFAASTNEQSTTRERSPTSSQFTLVNHVANLEISPRPDSDISGKFGIIPPVSDIAPPVCLHGSDDAWFRCLRHCQRDLTKLFENVLHNSLQPLMTSLHGVCSDLEVCAQFELPINSSTMAHSQSNMDVAFIHHNSLIVSQDSLRPKGSRRSLSVQQMSIDAALFKPCCDNHASTVYPLNALLRGVGFWLPGEQHPSHHQKSNALPHIQPYPVVFGHDETPFIALGPPHLTEKTIIKLISLAVGCSINKRVPKVSPNAPVVSPAIINMDIICSNSGSVDDFLIFLSVKLISPCFLAHISSLSPPGEILPSSLCRSLNSLFGNPLKPAWVKPLLVSQKVRLAAKNFFHALTAGGVRLGTVADPTGLLPPQDAPGTAPVMASSVKFSACPGWIADCVENLKIVCYELVLLHLLDFKEEFVFLNRLDHLLVDHALQSESSITQTRCLPAVRTMHFEFYSFAFDLLKQMTSLQMIPPTVHSFCATKSFELFSSWFRFASHIAPSQWRQSSVYRRSIRSTLVFVADVLSKPDISSNLSAEKFARLTDNVTQVWDLLLESLEQPRSHASSRSPNFRAKPGNLVGVIPKIAVLPEDTAIDATPTPHEVVPETVSNPEKSFVPIAPWSQADEYNRALSEVVTTQSDLITSTRPTVKLSQSHSEEVESCTAPSHHSTPDVSVLAQEEWPGRRDIEIERLEEARFKHYHERRMIGRVVERNVDDDDEPDAVAASTSNPESCPESRRESGASSLNRDAGAFEARRVRFRWQLVSAIGKSNHQVFQALNLNTGEFMAAKKIKLNHDIASSQLPADDGESPVQAHRTLINPTSPDSAQVRLKKLHYEMNMLSAVRHPNVLRYYGFDIMGSVDASGPSTTVLLFTEFCRGGDLHTLIRAADLGRHKGFDVTTRRYARQMTEGLRELHSRNIIHGDLKPRNIFLSHDHEVCKLGDFDLAVNVRFQDHPTRNGAAASTSSKIGVNQVRMMGTFFYMAPEQHGVQFDAGGLTMIPFQDLCDPVDASAVSETLVDPAQALIWSGPNQDSTHRALAFCSDIWGLGCTILEMITGEQPWGTSMSDVQVVFQLVTHQRTPPIDKNSNPDAISFLEHCLKFAPKARWTADTLLRLCPFVKFEVDCPASLVSATSGDHRATSPTKKSGPRRKKHPSVV